MADMVAVYTTEIPPHIRELHAIAVCGGADDYKGNEHQLVRFDVTPLMQRTWPLSLAGYKEIWLIYGGKA